MTSILEALRALSPANRVLIAVAVVGVVLWVWTSLRARWRDREHTVYVLPDDATFGQDGRRDATSSEPTAAPAPATAPGIESRSVAEPGARPSVASHQAAGDDEVAETPATRTPDAPDAAIQTPPWAPDWAEGRRLCPCCGYATDYTPARRCSLCDWEEPPEPVLDDDLPVPPNPDDLLDEARARYRTTGSALTPEERAEWLGPLTPSEIELRRQLHDRLEYLRTGDRPDSSETWETIGRIIDDLHREQEREGLDS